MALSFNPGQLDTLITVLSVTPSRGSQGQKKETTATYGQVFAHLEPTTDEMVSDGNLEALTTMAVTIYRIPAMTTRWKLLSGGIAYEIVSIDTHGRLSNYYTLSLKTIEKG